MFSISNGMGGLKLQNSFFFTILIAVLVLTFFIFLPYVSVLIVALVLSIVSEPLHKKILARVKGKETLAAIITLFIVLIIVLAPLLFVGSEIFRELAGLYDTFTAGEKVGGVEIIHDGLARFQSTFLSRVPIIDIIDINAYITKGLQWSLSNFNALFSGAAKLFLDLFLFVIALYYFIRDGEKLKKNLVALSPLSDNYDEEILKKLHQAVNSVVKGSLTVAIIQGALVGIGFTIFGIPNPTLWGAVAAITSLIPGLGTALIIVPGIIYLFLLGHDTQAILLMVWGVAVVGVVDNFLAPQFMKRGTNIHPFFVLLSVLGGLGMFGPIGFLLGPLTLSLLFALLSIYRLYVAGGNNQKTT